MQTYIHLKLFIKQLRKILPHEKVIVNTESEKIADHALANGAKVHWRDPYFSEGHKASFSELIMHVISQIESEHIAWTPFVVPFFDSDQFLFSFNNYKRKVINGNNDIPPILINQLIASKNLSLYFTNGFQFFIFFPPNI